MEVLRRVPPTCNCLDRVSAFADAERAAGRVLAIGSEVQCDCGLVYRLSDSQRDGACWQKMIRT